MDDYYYSTDEPHYNNIETMQDYLDNEMPDVWSVLFSDGTYAEIETPYGDRYEVHASGNGTSYNHRISFKPISPKEPDND